MATHVMIDLETLSTRSNACILQIAALAFDPETGEHHGAFQRFVKDGGTPERCPAIEVGTVGWWLKQKAAGWMGVQLDTAAPIKQALAELSAWFQALGDVEAVWCHGLTFDLPILQTAFDDLAMPVPWHYRAPRDTRTLYALAPGGMPAVELDEARKHDALYDCEVQVQQVVGALDAISDLKREVEYLA